MRTVQGDIENALKILTREEIPLTASGRTDTGVHAMGQVAHFDTNSELPLRKFCTSLNGILSNDISILNAMEVDSDFHSRFSAVEREYLYIVYNNHQRSPFMFHRALWINYNVDLEYIREATSYLIGEHDFASFCKIISSDCKTIRTINSIDIHKDKDLLYFKINGNAFLHNMIRILMGTIFEMYENNHPAEYMKDILSAKDRLQAGRTMPPYGLYLYNIKYNPSLSSYPSAFDKFE